MSLGSRLSMTAKVRRPSRAGQRAHAPDRRAGDCARPDGVRLNPLPSSGGLLIAFALALLAEQDLDGSAFGAPEHLLTLARVLEQTNLARTTGPVDERLLHDDWVARHRRAVHGRPLATRGTTHISVLDARGNAASLSLSNGDGSGQALPGTGTGIMPSNMLGEEDLNPEGFHRWGEPNLFFGGTHTVVFDGRQFTGAGDPRRGGVLQIVP